MVGHVASRIKGRIVREIRHRIEGIPGHFVQAPPGPKNMLSLFDGWASRLPFCPDDSGKSDLFDDERVRWFLGKIGGISGRSILELGPLEGGHSCMLQHAGAARVTAVESNGLAWLKCLAVKETLELRNTRFLFGDFVKYLEQTPESFDAILACGVLYHLVDPHLMFQKMRKVCHGPVFLWTMVWSDDLKAHHPRVHKEFSSQRTVELPNGKLLVLHKHEYNSSMFSGSFWGGNRSYSEWMSLQGILDAAEAAGYRVVERAFDEPHHQNGPAVALLLEPSSAEA